MANEVFDCCKKITSSVMMNPNWLGKVQASRYNCLYPDLKDRYPKTDPLLGQEGVEITNSIVQIGWPQSAVWHKNSIEWMIWGMVNICCKGGMQPSKPQIMRQYTIIYNMAHIHFPKQHLLVTMWNFWGKNNPATCLTVGSVQTRKWHSILPVLPVSYWILTMAYYNPIILDSM